jgi:hypothetical protein
MACNLFCNIFSSHLQVTMDEFFQSLEFFCAIRLDSEYHSHPLTGQLVKPVKFVLVGSGSEIRSLYYYVTVPPSFSQAFPASKSWGRITDSMSNRCLSCICPSYNKHSILSNLELRNSSMNLFGRHCGGVGKARVQYKQNRRSGCWSVKRPRPPNGDFHCMRAKSLLSD